jgi:hypothetical protein
MPHPAVGLGALDDRSTLARQKLTQFIVAWADDAHHSGEGGLETAQGCHADRGATREGIQQFASAEPRSGPSGE